VIHVQFYDEIRTIAGPKKRNAEISWPSASQSAQNGLLRRPHVKTRVRKIRVPCSKLDVEFGGKFISFRHRMKEFYNHKLQGGA
jgi:hypothetical protein